MSDTEPTVRHFTDPYPHGNNFKKSEAYLIFRFTTFALVSGIHSAEAVSSATLELLPSILRLGLCKDNTSKVRSHEYKTGSVLNDINGETNRGTID